MKNRFKRGRGEKGFTLIEIVIVLAVMAVLAAIIVPNISGFLGRGKERGWDADRNVLQAAVDMYRTDIGNRVHNSWPTLGNLKGTPTYSTANATSYRDTGDKDLNLEANEDTNSFIDIATLITSGSLRDSAIQSVDWRLNSDNLSLTTITGSYGWYIDSNGIVDAVYWNDVDNDGEVDASEIESVSGYHTDIYP